jgi:4-hydroxybenzoate polyprenyltransferase
MLSPKIKALLATARIANVPSVVSNVFTGSMIALMDWNDEVAWNLAVIPIILAGICLYIAGNFLNDWYDAAWDEKNRPERAIPSGLFSRRLYLLISIFLAILGLFLVVAFCKLGILIYCIIVALVVLYTILHKKHKCSIWVMGACRSGLFLLGCALVDPFTHFLIKTHLAHPYNGIFLASQAVKFLAPPIGMMCYIAGISLLARFETGNQGLTDGTKVIAAMLLLTPCLTHSCYYVYEGFIANKYYIFLAVIPFLAWTAAAIFQKTSVQSKVSSLLAGISLVDVTLITCAILVQPRNCISVSDVAYLLVSLLCFFTALLLQKIAPAT